MPKRTSSVDSSRALVKGSRGRGAGDASGAGFGNVGSADVSCRGALRGPGAVPPLSFSEALEVLRGALKFGINPSLDGIRGLTGVLGRPQDGLACVQVTGTNGKTSVTRLTAALIAAHGLCSASYTSPHLESYTERMTVSGSPVSEADFARAIATATYAAELLAASSGEAGGGAEAASAAAEGGEASGRSVSAGLAASSYTEFELLTCAALWLFQELGVDWAVLEVGMGGRWDATSVVSPAVAVITGVGLDHVDRLGHTVAEIAADKAQIVKPASSPVFGPATVQVADILLARAAEFGLHPRFVVEAAQTSPVADELTVRFHVAAYPTTPGGELRVDVAGVHGDYRGLALFAPSYQAANVAVAVAAAEAALGRALDVDAVRDALGHMTFPGRFEVVRAQPPLVLDGAHNPQAAGVLAEAIDEAFPGSPPMAVLGVLDDKDAEGIVSALAGHVLGFVATQADSPRAIPAKDLAASIERLTGRPCPWYEDVAEAIRHAEQVTSGGVVVSGSLYTAGLARTLSQGS